MRRIMKDNLKIALEGLAFVAVIAAAYLIFIMTGQ